MKSNLIIFRRFLVAKMSYTNLKYQLFRIIRTSLQNFHLLNQNPKTFETFDGTLSVINKVLGALSSCIGKLISNGCAI